MRKSRVLLAGVAVAAAAAATSAFTASNTFTGGPLVAGYGQVAVSGATVTNVSYTLLSTDKSKLDEVVFTTTTDVSAAGLTATMVIKNGSTVIATSPACVKGTYGTDMTLTCDATGDPLVSSFDAIGLTVSQ